MIHEKIYGDKKVKVSTIIPEHRGLSEALRTGFSEAKGDILIFWPADLQYRPEEIPKLVAKIEEGYDVVCGWRQGNDGFFRGVVSSVYNFLCRILFNIKIHDLNGVKAFRREVVEAIWDLNQ